MAAEFAPPQPSGDPQPQFEILPNSLPKYEFRGNTDVFVALQRKAQFLREGRVEEAAQYRIGVVCDGGGQAVCNETGAMEEFYDRGFFDGAIDVVIAASGGAVVMANAVPGNKDGERIFEENCNNDFFNPRNVLRVVNGQRGVINFSGYRATLDKYSVSLDSLKEKKTDMYVMVVDSKTGEQKRINLKELPSQKALNDVLFASCCMPVLGDLKSGDIDGVAHIDGGLPGLDVEQFVKDFDLTHVLVLRSHPIEGSQEERQKAHILHALSRIPGVRRNVAIREGLGAFKNGMDTLGRTFRLHFTHEHLALGMFAPMEKTVDILCMNYGRIHAAMRGSRLVMKQLLDENRPAEVM